MSQAEPIKVARSLKTSKVISEELRRIRARRNAAYQLAGDGAPRVIYEGDEDRRQTQARVEALDEHLVGMSFSGGGIRAGTFAIGFLQGLSSLGLLRRIDYLSTVSGGGYAGGWLAAWLKREGGVLNVEKQLDPSNVEEAEADRYLLPRFPDAGGSERTRVVDDEPEPLRHLREYSSYMTPRSGLLTADTWTVIAIWSRNVAINLMLLFPMAMLLVLAARMIVFLYGYVGPESIDGGRAPWYLKWILLLIGASLFLLGFGANGFSLREFRRQPRQGGQTQSREGVDYRVGKPSERFRGLSEEWYNILILSPIVVGVVALTVSIRAIIWWVGDLAVVATGGPHKTTNSIYNWASDFVSANLDKTLGVPNIALHSLGIGLVLFLGTIIINLKNGTLFTRDAAPRSWVPWRFHGRYLVAATMAGVTGGVLLPLLETLIKALNEAEMPGLMATIVPPLALLSLVAGFVVEVALLGREITEAEREWWARLSASLLIAALLWLVAMATIVFVPPTFLAAGVWARAALASGWIGATAFGVLSGRYAMPSRPGGGGSTVATIAAFVPPIFLIGFLGATALLVAYMVNMPSLTSPVPSDQWAVIGLYAKGVAGTRFPVLLAWAIVFGGLAAIASTLVDVNLFSLHAMYANRLIRCYLGASRPKSTWEARWGGDHDPRAVAGAPSLSEGGGMPPYRDANPITGFDLADDIPLFDLRIGPNTEGPRDYWGPHLIINTTLDLVAGKELAWRDRKGESFVMTPLHCGSKSVGYARVTRKTRANLTLGRAIAISGAAVDPNMKFYQSAALTAFLTIFNARLGYWIQNPLFKGWRAEGPSFGNRLIDELLGKTDDANAYVHLSDGGHFENLGVYELVRRRCRYIVALDAGEDADASDDNLADLIRLCRIDFGIRIQLDTGPLLEAGPGRLARTHVVVGRVRYDDVDNSQLPGIIVYVKISMTGDEPSDVQKYARKDPRFPHQPTDLRQSFDEEQFESYRALGDHIARDVFGDAVRKVRDAKAWDEPEAWSKPKDRHHYILGNRRFFSTLRGRWAAPPADHDERFLASSRRWTDLQEEIRKDPALAGLSRDLYPEQSKALDDPSSGTRNRAELHAVAQMLQIMEEAWLSLGLKGHRDLPMDRGWMNAFRRWAGTEAFRRLWPALRPEFSPDFAEFCETQLHLETGARPKHYRLAAGPLDAFEADAIRAIGEEFRREWPDEDRACDLVSMIAKARALNLPRPPLWLLLQAPSGAESVLASTERFACGVVLARETDWARKVAHQFTEAKQDSPTFELFAWVRRPHRSMGLGSRSFGPILEELKRDLQAARPGVNNRFLLARYPKSNQRGASDIELGMWLNFFALYDFRPVVPPKGDQRTDTILWHRF